jgi:hypothetical protein
MSSQSLHSEGVHVANLFDLTAKSLTDKINFLNKYFLFVKLSIFEPPAHTPRRNKKRLQVEQPAAFFQLFLWAYLT